MPIAEDLQNYEAMVDLETLATTPNAHILTIGFVAMHELSNTLYIRVLKKNQNRRIDLNTEKWWSKQSQEAQDEAFSTEGAVSIPEALDQITTWFQAGKMKKIWSHGATFDVAILDNAYRQHEKFPPWRFGDVRDTRTVIDIAQRATGKKLEPVRQGTYHNALDDAVHQAKWINNILSLVTKD